MDPRNGKAPVASRGLGETKLPLPTVTQTHGPKQKAAGSPPALLGDSESSRKRVLTLIARGLENGAAAERNVARGLENFAGSGQVSPQPTEMPGIAATERPYLLPTSR